MKRIKLTRGYWATVDDIDYDYLNQYKWSYAGRDNEGYAARSTSITLSKGKYKGVRYLMHRLILNASSGLEVDHINGNRLDNRRSNLRLCTHRENSRNTYRRNNKRFKGVYYWPRDNNWRAKITVNRKTIHIGYYDTEEMAAKAYDKAALHHFGEFARLNNAKV